MIDDEGLIDRDFIGIDADLGSDVAGIRGRECEPFVVSGEACLRGSIGVSVRTEGGYCTKPRFLDENDVEIVVIPL